MTKKKKKTIWFLRRHHGEWVRHEGKKQHEVNEEAMYKEISQLIDKKWKVDYFGITHILKIKVESP